LGVAKTVMEDAMLRSCSQLLVGVLVLGALSTGFANAHDEPAAAITLPLSPDPARCTVSSAEVNPEGVVMADPEAATPPGIAEGAAVDVATQAAITELIVTVLACSANGNNGLADAALLTEEHLRAGLAELSREDFDAFYTETPDASPPEHWIMLYALHDFRMLPDGRVAVNPDVIVPGVGRFIDTLILEKVDGTWLIAFSLEGEGNIYATDVPGM
jgi:hypothetical protein